MDAEEELDGMSALEEEVDQLQTHELYTGPFPSAEVMPHDLDGPYGFVEPVCPYQSSMYSPNYNSSLVEGAGSFMPAALHMIPTSNGRNDSFQSPVRSSIHEREGASYFSRDPAAAQRPYWPAVTEHRLSLLNSQIIEAPGRGLPYSSHDERHQPRQDRKSDRVGFYPIAVEPPAQPFPSRVRVLGSEDIQANPKSVSSRPAKGGSSSKASRVVRRLAVETKSSTHKPSARVKKRSQAADGDEHWKRPRHGRHKMEPDEAPADGPSSRLRTQAKSARHAPRNSDSEFEPQETGSRQKHCRPNSVTYGRNKSSIYRGVTRHRRSGRYEAHLWIKELHRQVYLGGYEHEEHAAEAYDVAALKSKGMQVKTNFDVSRYTDLTACMHSISLEELIMAVRRQSQGFSRGSSSYRGVTHHPSGRWEARIGIPGSKHIYLGLHNDEDAAAKAYDSALVRLRGVVAATNFSLSEYRSELADYHRKQQALLEGVESVSDLSEFEDWIKNGYKTETSRTTISSMDPPSNQTPGGVVEEPQGSQADSEEKPALPIGPRTRSSRAFASATILPTVPWELADSNRPRKRRGKASKVMEQLREEVQSDDQILIHSSRPTLGAAKRLSMKDEAD